MSDDLKILKMYVQILGEMSGVSPVISSYKCHVFCGLNFSHLKYQKRLLLIVTLFDGSLCVRKLLPDLRWLIVEGCAGVSPRLDCYSITGLKLTRGLFDWELSTAPRDAAT